MGEIQVLVLGVGGNVSQGILTALKHSTLDIRIIGACISDDSLGLYMCDTAYISPFVKEDGFIHWVINVCNKENIDIILSGVEEIIYTLECNRTILEKQTSAIFIASDIEKLTIGNDKLKTVEWLKEHSLNYPKYACLEDKNELGKLITQCGFPLIAKPRRGKGSNGIYVVTSLADLNKLNVDEYIVNEYIGDENNEYTVACYVDRSGKLQDLIIMRRYLKYGTTFKAEIIQDESIKNECIKICNAFAPIGPLNIQLRMHNGKPVCFELNVRYSGTISIRARWGYNDIEAMICEYILNQSVEDILKPQASGLVYRYFNEFFVDESMHEELKKEKIVKDCLVYNNFQQ